jgi:hypothetical protein
MPYDQKLLPEKGTPEYYMSEISTEVANSLTSEQKKEIFGILQRAIVVPKRSLYKLEFGFYFIRRYFVTIDVSHDLRFSNIKYSEEAQIEREKRIIRYVLYMPVLIFFLAFIFFLLYFLKSIIGVDLFPEQHLGDFIR